MTRRERLVHLAWAAADAIFVVLATYLAAWVRYDMNFDQIGVWPITQFALLACLLHLILGVTIGPYRVGHLRGSFEETADIGRIALVSAVLLEILVLTGLLNAPRSLPIVVPAFAVIAMFTLRFVVRSYRWGRSTNSGDDHRIIVFGAGEGGRQLVRAIQRDPHSTYTPIAVLDDDPRKRRLKIDGVPVKGGLSKLGPLAAASGARTLVIAMPSAEADLVREISARAREADLEVLTLPPVAELIGGAHGHDLRELNLEDLLGRRRVSLDEEAIRTSIAGKTVLVTGAGGSIGAELCRQISRFDPARLIMLDRDESALHGVQMSLTGRALLDDGTLALADIRDLEVLRAIFQRERPEVVFHAAALKHLTLLEQFPLEAWKSNVVGTLNVLQAAHETGVETFVNISTDKAANPTCVLGYSKRLAERLTADFARRGRGTFVSVRFGNVLGSRGSVITAFTAQIERGGPITVTHPEVERYFMLIPEACQLVLQASAIGQDGNVMVLEMGEPVRIVDVARTLIDLSGKHDTEIVYTGLRPGEKLTEELFVPGEDVRRSAHPQVNHVSVPALAPSVVRASAPTSPSVSREWMQREATIDIPRTTPSPHPSPESASERESGVAVQEHA